MTLKKLKFTILLFTILFVLFNLNSSLVFGIRPIPASYYGTITIDGEPANPLTFLASCVDGIGRGSIVTTNEGEYGQESGVKLMTVSTNEDDVGIVYFCVENRRSNENISWSSGDIQNVNLTFTNRIDGCPACFVNWDCTQWSSCQENEIGEYTQICIGTWVDLNSCNTDFEKPNYEDRECQSDDDDNDNNNNNNNGGDNGGGGTGGAGVPTGDNDTENNITDEFEPVTEDVKEISSAPLIVGENEEFSFEFRESKIFSIKITFKEQVENPSLSLEMSDNKPEGTTEVSYDKLVYKYFSINKNFDSTKMAGAVIEFKVETNWLARNNVYPEDVLLLHFNGKEWKELDTKLTGLEIDSYKFEAETDSFSFFAITAKKRTKSTTTYFVITIVILILIVLIFNAFNKKKGKIKNET